MLNVVDKAVDISALRQCILELDESDIDELLIQVKVLVEALDEAILESKLLPEAYAYNGKVMDPDPDPDFLEKNHGHVRDEHFTMN